MNRYALATILAIVLFFVGYVAGWQHTVKSAFIEPTDDVIFLTDQFDMVWWYE